MISPFTVPVLGIDLGPGVLAVHSHATTSLLSWQAVRAARVQVGSVTTRYLARYSVHRSYVCWSTPARPPLSAAPAAVC